MESLNKAVCVLEHTAERTEAVLGPAMGPGKTLVDSPETGAKPIRREGSTLAETVWALEGRVLAATKRITDSLDRYEF